MLGIISCNIDLMLEVKRKSSNLGLTFTTKFWTSDCKPSLFDVLIASISAEMELYSASEHFMAQQG